MVVRKRRREGDRDIERTRPRQRAAGRSYRTGAIKDHSSVRPDVVGKGGTQQRMAVRRIGKCLSRRQRQLKRVGRRTEGTLAGSRPEAKANNGNRAGKLAAPDNLLNTYCGA